jgi:hypothetical protein
MPLRAAKSRFHYCRACPALVPVGAEFCCETCRQFWEHNYGEEIEPGRETVIEAYPEERRALRTIVNHGWRVPLQNSA